MIPQDLQDLFVWYGRLTSERCTSYSSDYTPNSVFNDSLDAAYKTLALIAKLYPSMFYPNDKVENCIIQYKDVEYEFSREHWIEELRKNGVTEDTLFDNLINLALSQGQELYNTIPFQMVYLSDEEVLMRKQESDDDPFNTDYHHFENITVVYNSKGERYYESVKIHQYELPNMDADIPRMMSLISLYSLLIPIIEGMITMYYTLINIIPYERYFKNKKDYVEYLLDYTDDEMDFEQQKGFQHPFFTHHKLGLQHALEGYDIEDIVEASQESEEDKYQIWYEDCGHYLVCEYSINPPWHMAECFSQLLSFLNPNEIHHDLYPIISEMRSKYQKFFMCD